MYPWKPYKNLDCLTYIDLLPTNASVSKFSKNMSLRNRAARVSFKDFGCYEGKSFKLQSRIINYRSYKNFSNRKCKSCFLIEMKIKEDFIKNNKGFETFCNKRPIWSLKIFIQFLCNDNTFNNRDSL